MRDFRRCCFVSRGKMHDAAIVDTVAASVKRLLAEQDKRENVKFRENMLTYKLMNANL